MISFDKNLPRSAVPIAQLMAIGGLDHHKSNGYHPNGNSSVDHVYKSVCYRYSQAAYYAEKHPSDIIHNQPKRCQKCRTTKHGTSACRTLNLECVCRAPLSNPPAKNASLMVDPSETAVLTILNNCSVSILELCCALTM
jgi:hypothetical protein